MISNYYVIKCIKINQYKIIPLRIFKKKSPFTGLLWLILECIQIDRKISTLITHLTQKHHSKLTLLFAGVDNSFSCFMAASNAQM